VGGEKKKVKEKGRNRGSRESYKMLRKRKERDGPLAGVGKGKGQLLEGATHRVAWERRIVHQKKGR